MKTFHLSIYYVKISKIRFVLRSKSIQYFVESITAAQLTHVTNQLYENIKDIIDSVLFIKKIIVVSDF